jgi:hypothetical protein
MAGTQDDYYNGRDASVYGNRVYVDDPYRGTIVLERDPRTGRYYEVNSPYYNGYYGNSYGRRYGRVYTSPNHRGNNGSYNRKNNNSHNQNTQRPTQDDRKTRDEARKKILGN